MGVSRAFQNLKTAATGESGGKEVGGLDRASAGLKGVAESISLLGAACVGPTTAITALGAALNGLVGKANPVVAEQFTLALNDLMGVIGQALTPLFQNVFIPVVRSAADALMQLAPAGASLAAALGPVVELVSDLFAGAIGILAEIIQQAAPFILAFGRVIQDVVRWVMQGVRDLLSLIGIELPGGEVVKGASVNAAAKQAGHTGVEEMVRKAQVSAFSLGNASGDPMNKMSAAMEATKSRADAIHKWLTETLPDILKGLPGLFVKALREGAEAVQKRLEGGFSVKKDFGVDFWDAAAEANKDFWNEVGDGIMDAATVVGNETWIGRQLKRSVR